MPHIASSRGFADAPKKPLLLVGAIITALMTGLAPVFCSAAAAAAPASAPTSTQPQVSELKPLPMILAEAMNGKTLPAMGVLVIRDGKVTEQAVRGERNLGGQPVAIGDRWNLGSDGKAMTATMIARLVERKLLRWDTPLAQMLPDLAADMRPEYRDVTLLELLSHRAGLPENFSDLAFFKTFYGSARPLPAQRLDYLRRAVAEAPIGPARAEASYSNTGLILAGVIAERATGRSYEQLMQQEVFRPLGIKSARFTQSPEAGELSGHVDGRIATASEGNPEMIVPAGGVRMSLADWAKFAIDQMNGESGHGKLLKAESYRLLHKPQGETVFALGWGVAPAIAGRMGPAFTHSGSDGNWYAFICLFPNGKNGVLVVANAGGSMGGDRAAIKVAGTVMQTLAPPAPMPKDAP